RNGAPPGRRERGRRRAPSGRIPGLTTGVAWFSRVSRIVIFLPSSMRSFALVFEYTRSLVRFIEHVIELLPNDIAAHRQIPAPGSPLPEPATRLEHMFD
ncbi:MAG TPA: hypothetical protein VGA66_13350, partial [Mycobacterium sp.]